MKAIIDEQRKKVLSEMATELVRWYRATHRPLPWRASRDPYRIWISEVMLQQTTVQAVVPYYERFLNELPNLETLANAKLEKVLELWSGLGYYSRARNLHKAALMLNAKSWPQTSEELLALPGFGPYTSRAVSSLAFGEAVGVLDGNVIRVLSRSLGLKLEWWKPQERNLLQQASDRIASSEDSYYTNQALMELGATVCTPQSPTCSICPISKDCKALKTNLVSKLPLKKPKRETEFWIWKPILLKRKSKVGLVKNNYAPFLKGQMIFPGVAVKKSEKPKKFEERHSITHHSIYIQPDRKNSLFDEVNSKDIQWVEEKNLKQVNPSSLLRKVIQLWSVAAIVTGGKQITFAGDNSHPHFSKDGNQVVYESKNRVLHTNAQIYELTLSTGKEKRITFSDGQAIKPFYAKNEKSIYYLSDTDLLKEKPSLFAPNSIKDPNIFETDLFEIEPLTLKIERILSPEKKKELLAMSEDTPAKKLKCSDAVAAVSEDLKKAIQIRPAKEGISQFFLYEFANPLENCDIQF